MGKPKKIQGLQDETFDDEELEDIMTEIQGLEKEFVQLKESTKKGKRPSKAKKEKSVLQHAMEREVKESLTKVDSKNQDSNFFDNNELVELQKDLSQLEKVEPLSVSKEPKPPAATKIEPFAKSKESKPPASTKIEPFTKTKESDKPSQKKKDEDMKEITALRESPSLKEKESGVMNFSGMGRMKRFELDFAVGKGNAKLTVEDGIAVQVAGIEIMINEDEGCRISAPGGIRLSVPID